MIDPQKVNEILETADIVDVIQDFVSLKKKGVNYLGLCPFHNEKTPSFTVSPSKGIFKCFGCGESGNVAGFLMKHERMSFPEAIKYLAEKYGFQIEEKEPSADEIRQKRTRESLIIITSFAERYFHDILFNHQEGHAIGLSYLKERGFRRDIIKKFKLGYSLDQFDGFTQEAEKKGYKLDLALKAGLVLEKNNHFYDRFRGRIIFPIHNLSGKAIGFGGRTLKKDPQTGKYINSPHTEIYDKSNVLYGLMQAKQTVSKQDKCYLVEGYTDVISMHQCGVENVVASSGTSLTTGQIRLIKRFTPNITVIYDGDQAGINASMRGIDLILEEGLNVKVITLPQGEDPDSFARKNSAEDFLEYIEQNEEDFIEFKAKLFQKESVKDPVKKSSFINDIVRTISKIPNNITHAVYIKTCSQLLDVEEEVLNSELRQIITKRTNKQRRRHKYISNKQKNTIQQTKNRSAGLGVEIHEREILRLLLNYGNQILFTADDNQVSGLSLQDDQMVTIAGYILQSIQDEREEMEFRHPLYQKLYAEIENCYAENGKIVEKTLSNHIDEQISSLVADLLAPDYELSKIWNRGERHIETKEIDPKKAIPKKILEYKNEVVKIAIKEATAELKNNKNDMEQIEIMQRIIALKELNILLSKELGDRTIQ